MTKFLDWLELPKVKGVLLVLYLISFVLLEWGIVYFSK